MMIALLLLYWIPYAAHYYKRTDCVCLFLLLLLLSRVLKRLFSSLFCLLMTEREQSRRSGWLTPFLLFVTLTIQPRK